jgi:branched-chain amino acid transport system ATP-binding protein
LSAALLRVRHLAVAYGRVEAVTGLSIEVQPGAITAIIGPNGAGKTTTLNALAGLLPARGEIELDGTALASLDVEARVEAGMVLVPESRELFTTMTVHDNLILGAYRFRGAGRGERAADLGRVFDIFPRLRERGRQLAGTLSGGERQMLAIGRALMCRPRLLMLDEPSLGLAPLIVKDIFRVIEDLRRNGAAILLVEQNARAALDIADTGYVIERGAIALEGPAAALAQDPKVAETYLGLPGAAG